MLGIENMKAVILAGGLGTRLSEETATMPKPMVEIGGRPILWHIMKMYSHHGVNDSSWAGLKFNSIKTLAQNLLKPINFISSILPRIYYRTYKGWNVTKDLFFMFNCNHRIFMPKRWVARTFVTNNKMATKYNIIKSNLINDPWNG